MLLKKLISVLDRYVRPKLLQKLQNGFEFNFTLKFKYSDEHLKLKDGYKAKRIVYIYILQVPVKYFFRK